MIKEAKARGEEYTPLVEDNEDFEWIKASSPCNLSDIQAIVYGGHSSRFWIYRKHLIAMDPE